MVSFVLSLVRSGCFFSNYSIISILILFDVEKFWSMAVMLNTLLLLCAVGTIQTVPTHDWASTRGAEKCGYESCTPSREGFLNVHIVPHSHDDVGWLKTVDQYYYGSRNNIQKAGVQYILDSVIKELWEDSKRRFIYVETAFFWKWWVRQSEAVQQKVHTLVREGRLQFVGGAWSMNDEAASHYHSTIDQFTWGLSKLNKTFGKCGLPRVGWQIDPFGHSREFASLLAGMGYDGLFLGRIDYQDKRDRMTNKNMEMVWRGDDALGKSSDIFTGILYNTYSPPPGFCFDVLCNDEPIIDDPDSPINNVESKVSDFLEICKQMSTHYRSNNILVTMGDDFQYQDAGMWFKNLDKLIQYSNLKAAKDGTNITLFYSTPTCYLKAVNDAKPTLPTKKDDFFPYASDPTAYWTGYFTSRPTTKYFEREGNNVLQMVKQLQVLADLDEHNEFVLNELKSAMGIMQHHDAITGTEKQHVTHDYERILSQAIDDAMIITRQAINKISQRSDTKPPILGVNRCRLNESSCDVSENSAKFVVTIYNPLAWQVKAPIAVPVTDGIYNVFGPNGESIHHQMYTLPETIRNIPSRVSIATHEITFITDLKPMSYKSFYISKHTRPKRDTNSKRKSEYYNNINEYWKDIKVKTDIDIRNIEDMPIKNDNKIPTKPILFKNVLKGRTGDKFDGIEEFLSDDKKESDYRRSRLSFPDLNDGEMRMLSDDPMIVERFDDDLVMISRGGPRYTMNTRTNEINISTNDGADVGFNISMYYYTGAAGKNTKPADRASGAYIFRPNEVRPKKLEEVARESVTGEIFEETQVVLDSNAYYALRIYNDMNVAYIDWVVGPISVDDNIGKEYIIKYETNLLNNGEFFTDSNGRQVLKRKLGYRPQWNVTLAEPVAGNYFPVTNEIYIENDNSRVVVITDRSEGGTSLIEGELELMLHRRLLFDDGFGVGEPLNETAFNKGLVVRGKQCLLLSSANNIDTRKYVLETSLSPNLMFSDAENLNFNDWKSLVNEYSWLNNDMPKGLHLLTIEPWGSKLLLRIENYLEDGDDSDVEINLNKILKHIAVTNVKETVLSANQWVNDHEAMAWKTENDLGGAVNDGTNDFTKVKLKARQIKTFIIDYQVKRF